MVKALLIGAAAFALWRLSTLVLLLIAAIVIASATEPGVTFFTKYKVPRPLAVILVYVIVIGIVASMVWFFVPPMLAEATNLVAILPQYLSQAQNFDLPFLSSENSTTMLQNLSSLQDTFIDTGAGVIGFLSSIFGGAFYFLLTIVISIYFSFQETGVEDFLRLVTPEKQRGYVIGLWKRSQRKIGLWMQGQLLLSLIIAILLFLGLSLLGVPYALLLAIYGGILELIPIFGFLTSALTGTAVALVSGGLTIAFITAGLYLIVNQFQAHLIYPLVVKKIVGVAPILVIIALIAGGHLAGFLGVLLSVPMAAVVQEFVNDIQKRRATPVE
jgi:predicted PurR-regulated permease PerM